MRARVQIIVAESMSRERTSVVCTFVHTVVPENNKLFSLGNFYADTKESWRFSLPKDDSRDRKRFI